MRVVLALAAVAMLVAAGVAIFATQSLQAVIGAHRDQLVARVEAVLGRPIAVGDVVPSWWPLGVRLRAVTVGEDARFGTRPLLTADGMVVAVRAWPLIRGRVEVSGVVLERPQLSLVRDVEGRWNVGSLGEPAPAADAAHAPGRERRRGARVPLEWLVGVALSSVHDGTLTVDDRRRGGATPLVLRHVRLRAEDVVPGATARVRIDAAVFASDSPDLRLDVEVPNLGRNDVEHAPFSARVELHDVDLAAVRAHVRDAPEVTGRLDRLTLDVTGSLPALAGTLELRTDDRTLRIGDVALGALQPLVVRARLASVGERVALEELHVALAELELDAHGEAMLDPWRCVLVIESEPGDTVALGNPKHPVRVGALGGRLVLDREGALLEPLRFEADGAPLEARGWITSLDPPALDVRVEGRPFDGTIAADVAVEKSGGARARLEAAGIDLGPAIARLVPALADRVEGRGTGAAVVTARVVGGRVEPGSVAGSGTLEVRGGRLRDVNLPDLVVEQIEGIPLMPQLVSARTRARYAELFASRDTVIESATVPFIVGHGRLTTENASVVNPAYQITGGGWLDEAEQLRFQGTVLLGASVSRTLRDDVKAAKYLVVDDGRVALPFVARGRLGHVWVEPDGKRLRARGLSALLGAPSDGGAERDRGDDEQREPRRQEPLEDKVIERLERMIHP